MSLLNELRCFLNLNGMIFYKSWTKDSLNLQKTTTMKTLFISLVSIAVSLHSFAQKYVYSPELNGSYLAKECSLSNYESEESVVVQATTLEFGLFEVLEIPCSADSYANQWVASRAFSAGTNYHLDMVMEPGLSGPSRNMYFTQSEGRVILVVLDYINDEPVERIFYRETPLDLNKLEEIDMNKWNEENSYEEDEFYEGNEYYNENAIGFEELPKVLQNYKWFDDFNGTCLINEDYGRPARIVQGEEYIMGILYMDFGYGNEITAYFYFDKINERIEQWKVDQEGSIEPFEDEFSIKENLSGIYFNRLQYDKVDCE